MFLLFLCPREIRWNLINNLGFDMLEALQIFRVSEKENETIRRDKI